MGFSTKKVEKKLVFTILALSFYALGNSIPLHNIDQLTLKKAFSPAFEKNALIQALSMFSSGTNGFISIFSLGIVPFINASIIIDLFTSLIPSLEALQSEEGNLGRKKILFYKKVLSLIFAAFQSYFFILFLKDFLYSNTYLSITLSCLELIAGSFSIIWISNFLDTRGVGNGTSLIILTNILVSFFIKSSTIVKNLTPIAILEIFILFLLVAIITISQKAAFKILLISARQLNYLKNIQDGNLKENILLIKYNQAGIFPLIIASNFLGFLSYFSGEFLLSNSIIKSLIYYSLILLFNYFYTRIIWDPEKISEQLRKSSVALANVTPGIETTKYLEDIVKLVSFRGGIILCLILFLFENIKNTSNFSILPEINIASVIIAISIINDLLRNLKSLRITKVLSKILLITKKNN